MWEVFRLEQDSAQVKFPPPFVYIGFLLTGLVIDRVTAQSPNFIPAENIIMIVAAIATVLGIGFMIAGNHRFRTLGNNVEPWKHANQIVTSGIYKHTRNPMYLGMSLLYLGLCLFFRSSWALILLPVVILVIRTQVIAREERYLEGKFGGEYLKYKQSVRRWL